VVLAGSGLLVALEIALVRAMAEGHVAHVLLGAGNAMPPLGPALLAVALVVTRVLALVLVPGAVLAALTALVAEVVQGATSRSGAGSSVAGAAGADGPDGTSIDGGGTE